MIFQVFVIVATMGMLALRVTTSNAIAGDVLNSTCSEACKDWEDWRRECFLTQCQTLMEKGGNWFPCYQSCWHKSRSCLAECADIFWELYTKCSAKCRLGHHFLHGCLHSCIVKGFLNTRKTEASPMKRYLMPTMT
ncbi:uncharacterized protein LOC112566282 isoform X2 [Pomacea canaliculata]|nr:uncharacterized protein LOC112566282 isoform X2 [Pomacea canaliculata]XP_025098149.1 uncharacterized protein LOC112566282 isoform X2 [Pomacea canaliculata]XP_025098157.1 uncharacterized protein LOC112566282 isoform X2 [Pomacea canaliculata]